MRIRWPFMLVSTHEAVRRENYTLRDVLRETNQELAKHRRLLAGLRDGRIDVTRALEKVLEKRR